MLGSPGGFSGGNGAGFGAGGSSLWRIARILLMRGDREAVGGNRVAQQRGDRSTILGGKIRLHSRNMQRRSRESESGPATLGTTAKAHLLLRVWCKDCRHRVDLDPGEQAERHGADLAVPEWAKRLSCSKCGSRNVDSIVAPRSTGGLGDR